MLRKEKWPKERTHWIPSIHTNNAMTSATILACSKSRILMTENDGRSNGPGPPAPTMTCRQSVRGKHLRAPVDNKGGNSQAGDGNNFAQTSTCHLPELVLDNRLVIWGMCPCSNRALGALVNGKDLDNLPELLICSQQYHWAIGSRLEEFSACCS